MRVKWGLIAAFVAIALCVSAGPADAVVMVLDFEGLADQEPVANFYSGGTGGSGSGPGPNFGIGFSANSLALIDVDAGGSGNFGGEPSPDTILFFMGGTAATMNVAAGFSTGFSFFYTAINNPGSVTVYSGVNATGAILATLPLPLTPYNGAPDPNGTHSPLVPIGVAFTGVAMSVDFAGVIAQIGFDDVTFGSETPGNGVIPEPATLTLLGIGLAGLGLNRLRRKKR
ncbi:MAG: PEP-CTERM sorting domain-containing protein [Candidatus Brocadiae bacterium]|nr:PEP-CTERM sorting domain-containing protein [Candidatus Brocadiia bacterium]